MTMTTAVTRMNKTRLEKTCLICNTTKPREEFPRKGQKNDSRWPACEACYPEYRKRTNTRNSEYKRRFDERQKTGQPVEKERVPWVSTVPIRKWLIEELGVPSVEASPNLSPFEKGKVREVAHWLRVSDRQIHRWRSGEADTTSLDVIDRALCEAGVPWMLREMFPELWDFSDEAEAA